MTIIDTISWIYRICSTFSVIGTLFAIIVFRFSPELRKYPLVMVYYLMVADFCVSLRIFLVSVIFNVTTDIGTSGVCFFSAIWQQFWCVCSVLWSGAIAFDLCLKLLNPLQDTRSVLKYFHFIIWPFAFLSTIMLVSMQRIGPEFDGLCWIAGEESLFHLIFVIPLILVVSVSVVTLIGAFVIVFRVIRRRQSDNTLDIGLFDLFRIISFVLVFFISWIGPAVHRTVLLRYSQPYDSSTRFLFLLYADVVGMSLHGFMNSAIFVFLNALVLAFVKNNTKNSRTSGMCKENDDLVSKSNFLNDLAPLIHYVDGDVSSLLRKDILYALLEGIHDLIYPRLNKSINSDASNDDASCNTNSVNQRLLGNNDAYCIPIPILVEKKMNLVEVGSYCVSEYHPEIFENIRRLSGISEEDYLEWLNTESFTSDYLQGSQSEGKSGSFFVFSPNNELVVKTTSEEEAKVLSKMAVQYMNHLSQHPQSLLVRILGLYQLTHNANTSFIVVMINLFGPQTGCLDRKYDLKGSWVDRRVGANHLPRLVSTSNCPMLGKDTDFHEKSEKLDLSDEDLNILEDHIDNDVHFLVQQKLMDYSVLLGIRELSEEDCDAVNKDLSSHGLFFSQNKSQVYYIGIIDVLQTYNIRKRIEYLFKTSILCKSRLGVSVQNPKRYGQRFVEYCHKKLTQSCREDIVTL